MRVHSNIKIQISLLYVLLFVAVIHAAIGQSSVITLAFPWGARSTGLGETFTGIADDEQALFYNPAGLGQPPLSKTWMHYEPQTIDSVKGFKTIVTQKGEGFGAKTSVWAVSESNEILLYRGDKWVGYKAHYIDTGVTLQSVAEKFIVGSSSEKVDRAISLIKKVNKKMCRSQEGQIVTILDSLKKSDFGKKEIAAKARSIINLAPSLQNDAEIYTMLLDFVKDDNLDEASSYIAGVVKDGTELEDLLEINIPFSIAIESEINSAESDESGRLWFATNSGLWRYETEWKQFTVKDGLPSDTVLSLVDNEESGEIIVATQNGAAKYSDGAFLPVGKDDGVTKTALTSVEVDNQGRYYFGTDHGLILIDTSGKESLLDTSHGLLNSNISTLLIDTRNRLWVGGVEGVSIFSGTEWKRYRFKGSVVKSISQERDSRLWLATNSGAIEYVESRNDNEAPQWKVHHEKNNLKSSDIFSVAVSDGDIWLATSNGVEQFKHGEVRATVFYEKLLPSLGIDDMWHAAAAGIIPLGEWGTIGVFVNNLFFGEITDYEGDVGGGTGNPKTSSAFEIVSGASYGLSVVQDFSLGINIKYAYSRLQEDEAEAHTFAIDAGLLKNNLITPRLGLGFSMLNMGPAVWYAEEDNKDPIPFTLRYGMSYSPIERSAYKLLLAFDLDREVVYKDPTTGEVYPFWQAIYYDLLSTKDGEDAEDEISQVILHGGAEFTYMDFISVRLGAMHDPAGQREEVNLGLGVKASSVAADFSIIFTLGDNDVRQNQVRFSLTYAR